MGVIFAITRRNLLQFLRDPLNIFFSLLSALILFLLYTLFLGNLQIESIGDGVPNADEDAVRGFVDAWMFGGIVALTTMTTPLAALSVFVDDSATGRFRDFLVSPIRRGQLVLGYLVSAFIIGVFLTTVVLVVALVYLWLVSGVVIAFAAVAVSFGWVLLSTAAFTALWAFIVSFVRTSGAFSALSTIVGTVVGFVAGAFIAVGLFPDGVRGVVSVLPFAQAASLIRLEFTREPLSGLVGGNQAAIDELNEFYGMTLSVADWSIPGWYAVGILVLLILVFVGLAAARIRSRIR